MDARRVGFSVVPLSRGAGAKLPIILTFVGITVAILAMERTGSAMRLQRITDPGSIDEGLIARSIANGAHRVVLQFSKESAYSPSILEDVNRACRTFGVKVNVRFWGHYGSQFDCSHLRRVPEVRSLNLDCLAGISNVAQIGHLDHLEEFSFGVFESISQTS